MDIGSTDGTTGGGGVKYFLAVIGNEANWEALTPEDDRSRTSGWACSTTR